MRHDSSSSKLPLKDTALQQLAGGRSGEEQETAREVLALANWLVTR